MNMKGGMKRQLEELCHILKYVDPVFYSYLDAKVELKESSTFSISLYLSGIWKFVFLLPLAAHLVQERVQLPGHLHSVGGSLDKDVSCIECADKDMCRLARLSGQR